MPRSWTAGGRTSAIIDDRTRLDCDLRRARPGDRPVSADAPRLPDPERRLGAADARPAGSSSCPKAARSAATCSRSCRCPVARPSPDRLRRRPPARRSSDGRRAGALARVGRANRERPPAPSLVLLPGPQRGGEPRGARRRGARDPAVARRHVRDRHRRRRLEGRDRRGSPTTWRRPTPASCGPSITRRTSATAPRSGRASGPPATSTSRSPMATASSRSPTSAG